MDEPQSLNTHDLLFWVAEPQRGRPPRGRPARPRGDRRLERLAAFHEAVAGLPAEEREVIGLTYYHGWSQADIADLFGVSVRTVQRWHTSAAEMIKQRCGG